MHIIIVLSELIISEQVIIISTLHNVGFLNQFTSNQSMLSLYYLNIKINLSLPILNYFFDSYIIDCKAVNIDGNRSECSRIAKLNYLCKKWY